MNDPKVSVIITTYNRPQLLERAVRSVLAQTYTNIEIIVIDDASANQTRNIAESILTGQKNYRYFRHNYRKGLAAARNTGIANSSGEYVAFLDDDDEWKPESLEKRINLFMKLASREPKKLGVVYCECEIRRTGKDRVTYNLPRITGDIKKNICERDLATIPSSCLFPKAVLEHIGRFDEKLSSSIDHDIWMNLAAHGYHAHAVTEPLVVTYRGRKLKTMVSDTIPRIEGVEQYLAKWAPTFEEWFGKKGAKKYIQRYRTRVLGSLAGKKLCEGNLGESFHLVRHVSTRNGCSPPDIALLSWKIIHHVLEMIVPDKLIDRIKRKKS